MPGFQHQSDFRLLSYLIYKSVYEKGVALTAVIMQCLLRGTTQADSDHGVSGELVDDQLTAGPVGVDKTGVLVHCVYHRVDKGVVFRTV